MSEAKTKEYICSANKKMEPAEPAERIVQRDRGSDASASSADAANATRQEPTVNANVSD